jgi:hypothetical protein
MRCENHNLLPNIVGSWLPRRDGGDDTKSYYYASMLALLKPWRNLFDLKDEDENWETAFNLYIGHANQRDKDVIAGCQYYYDSREVARERLNNVDKDVKDRHQSGKDVKDKIIVSDIGCLKDEQKGHTNTGVLLLAITCSLWLLLVTTRLRPPSLAGRPE